MKALENSIDYPRVLINRYLLNPVEEMISLPMGPVENVAIFHFFLFYWGEGGTPSCAQG